ncbi:MULTISPECIES: threonine/serine exporter family protein [unclassified Lactobacillus]|uniref:threonine/serine exporter family protein n=1 Tax=unclassified Lactobacillus TaxID=2620435 RepID=UPI000EFCE799|nr:MULTISPECIES: threonine/serine exporter family protein [unclassified Lactobacillus]RMC23702.1 threonine/serine exporter [Lactobacillus sp. ESL0247]RMC27462.1 threonine/serine exporter [Lactobacillus sp. ESL0246]RMC30663.1 threonine/serine exporter [Lactobacillus sp. ESL0245]RMC47242.1 threonine/serine exporter [Lactobacillus sp. ESL0228]
MPLWLEIIINLIFAYGASVGFALTINVPRRVLNLSGMAGVICWIIYWLAMRANMGRLIANLLGSFAVGILGIIFARRKKCPATVFYIPAIVPLVPGVPAYQAVRRLTSGNIQGANDAILRVIVVTGAIALGMLLSNMCVEIFFRIKKFYKRNKDVYNK